MVNGEMISKTDVIDFCEKVKALRLDFQPSFFEITWVMALVYFASKDCDICVVETGLGGRLDATNLIHPLFSVITNIGLEHTNILGDTLEKIAFEKAGIIKDNVPVIIGETLNETIKVFKEIAKSKKSDIFFAEENCDKLPDNFPLLGEYQKKNFKIIQTAIPLLRKEGFEIVEASLAKGLLNISSNTSFKARLQIINTSPLVILDVSHNYDGIKATLETIYTINKGHLYLLFGSSSDKDLDQIFTLFPKDASYFFTEFKNERSATIQTLEKKSAENNLQSFFFTKSQDAYSQIQSIVNKDDTVLIFGSFFLVSEFF